MTGAIGQLLSVKSRLKRNLVQRDQERKVQNGNVQNDQLDDALRQTFPASDALSIIQSVRC